MAIAINHRITNSQNTGWLEPDMLYYVLYEDKYCDEEQHTFELLLLSINLFKSQYLVFLLKLSLSPSWLKISDK